MDTEETIQEGGKRFGSAKKLAKEFGYKNYKSVISVSKNYDIPMIPFGASGKLYIDEDAFRNWYVNERELTGMALKKINEYDANIEPFMNIYSENVIIFADAHVPFLDLDLFWDMLAFAKTVGARKIISVGDFWDMETFSYWTKEIAATPWEDEEKFGKKVLNVLVEQFDEVNIILGSHDKRLARCLSDKGKHLTITYPYHDFMENPKVRITYHQKAILNTGQRTWHLEHPGSVFRVGSITSGRRQATLETNLVFAHGHFQGIERSYSGKHYIIALGMSADPSKLFYRTIPRSYAEVNQGFLWIRDEVPRIIYKDEVETYIKDYGGKRHAARHN